MNDAIKLNRKDRRRAEAKIERQARDAHRREVAGGGVLVDRAELEALHMMQGFFIGVAKMHGRVRVAKAVLDSLTPGDRVTRRDDGDNIILTFVAGAPAEGNTDG